MAHCVPLMPIMVMPPSTDVEGMLDVIRVIKDTLRDIQGGTFRTKAPCKSLLLSQY